MATKRKNKKETLENKKRAFLISRIFLVIFCLISFLMMCTNIGEYFNHDKRAKEQQEEYQKVLDSIYVADCPDNFLDSRSIKDPNSIINPSTKTSLLSSFIDMYDYEGIQEIFVVVKNKDLDGKDLADYTDELFKTYSENYTTNNGENLYVDVFLFDDTPKCIEHNVKSGKEARKAFTVFKDVNNYYLENAIEEKYDYYDSNLDKFNSYIKDYFRYNSEYMKDPKGEFAQRMLYYTNKDEYIRTAVFHGVFFIGYIIVIITLLIAEKKMIMKAQRDEIMTTHLEKFGNDNITKNIKKSNDHDELLDKYSD